MKALLSGLDTRCCEQSREGIRFVDAKQEAGNMYQEITNEWKVGAGVWLGRRMDAEQLCPVLGIGCSRSG